MLYLGVDPGKSGAIAALNEAGNVVCVVRLTETPTDVCNELRKLHEGDELFAFMEQVNAMPKQGVSSTFKFGQSYGGLEWGLTALQIPFERHRPVAWQKAMQCLSKGDKNVTKRRAQELFPNEKVIHATADALLIAEFCRREVSRT